MEDTQSTLLHSTGAITRPDHPVKIPLPTFAASAERVNSGCPMALCETGLTQKDCQSSFSCLAGLLARGNADSAIHGRRGGFGEGC